MKLKMIVTENNTVLFENVTEIYKPYYRWWSGQITQAEEEGITCIPNNTDALNYLGVIGVPENSAQQIGFIPRMKEGSYSWLLPYEKKDIYIYFNDVNVKVQLGDMGDGTTMIDFQTSTDGIINWLNFEIKVKQHYE